MCDASSCTACIDQTNLGDWNFESCYWDGECYNWYDDPNRGGVSSKIGWPAVYIPLIITILVVIAAIVVFCWCKNQRRESNVTKSAYNTAPGQSGTAPTIAMNTAPDTAPKVAINTAPQPKILYVQQPMAMQSQDGGVVYIQQPQAQAIVGQQMQMQPVMYAQPVAQQYGSSNFESEGADQADYGRNFVYIL